MLFFNLVKVTHLPGFSVFSAFILIFSQNLGFVVYIFVFKWSNELKSLGFASKLTLSIYIVSKPSVLW